MCVFNVIAYCFEVPNPFDDPIETMKTGIINAYRYIYSNPNKSKQIKIVHPVRQCWFLINLFMYSLLMLPIFDMFHPKHRNREKLEQNSSGTRLWIYEYISTYNLLPQAYVDFTSICTKLMMGRIRIVMFPGFMITAEEVLWRKSHRKDIYDFYNHMSYDHAQFILMYFLGYVFISVRQSSIDEIVNKNGLYYLISGSLLLYGVLLGSLELHLTTNTIINRLILITLTGYGRWMVILGLYGAMSIVCTKEVRIFGMLRRITTPFYLLHVAILKVVHSILIALIMRFTSCSKDGNPVYCPDPDILSSNGPSTFMFPILFLKVLFGLLITCIISYLITKSPSAVKYCFGLATSKSYNKYKNWFDEYGLLIFLVFIKLVGYALVNWTDIAHEI